MTHLATLNSRLRTILTSFVGAAVVVCLIFYALSLTGSNYWMAIAISAATYIALGLGLNVVLGYAGLLDIGYAAFFAIGAYASAILTVKFGANFFLAIPLGILITGLSGVIIGYPTLRLRPDYLAIVTIGFGEVTRTAFNNWDFAGATRGLYPLPNPELFGFAFDTPEKQLLLAGVMVAVVIAFSNRLGVSHIGRAWRAIRDDDTAAEAVGIPTLRLKIGAYVLGGAIGSIAGMIFASRSVAIDPTNFTLYVSVQILMVVVLGGLGSVRGVVLAAGIFIILPELLREVEEYRMLVFAVLVILMVRFRPAGLIPERESPDPEALPDLESAEKGSRKLAALIEPRSRDGDAGGESLLSAKGITQIFGGLKAIDNVDIDVKPGQIVGLIGPNGAGKTSLVNVLTGVAKPKAGVVKVAGSEVTGRRPNRIVRSGVARTFQAIRLFPQLSVIDNVMSGAHQVSQFTLREAFFSPRSEREKQKALVHRAYELLAAVGIEELAMKKPSSLSYADRRRVEIARALASNPRLLILDEPAAGMNPTEKRELVSLLKEIADAGVGILLVEHDMPLIVEVVDEALVLDRGREIARGKPEIILRDPAVVEAYLGGSDVLSRSVGPKSEGEADAI